MLRKMSNTDVRACPDNFIGIEQCHTELAEVLSKPVWKPDCLRGPQAGIIHTIFA